jgi:phage replication initiation protein
MSGQGCRAFETYGHGDWEKLFREVQSSDLYHVTRLDAALDDHIGMLNLDVMKRDAEAGNFVCKMVWGKVEHSLHDGAITIYHGSPRSNVRFRIYDKAKERGYTDGRHWVRFEIQMRDDNAARFLGLLALRSVGEVFAGVVNNYLRYVKPNETDTNKWRWETADYWYNFIHTAEKISLYTKPGTEYNLASLEHFVVHQAGASAATYIDVYGLDAYVTAIAGKLKASVNPKYTELRKKYGRGKLAGVVPKAEAVEPPREKMITCEICGRVLESKEFVYYNTGTERGRCRECDGSAVFKT